MSVRMRHTRSHTNNRRCHHALSGVHVILDKESGAMRLPHRMDETTGSYRGKVIAKPKEKKERTKSEKYDHPAHTHTESMEKIKDKSKKLETSVTHKRDDSLPMARRGA